ncbi:L,D-transpeptidase/peptidoglycan binding protein [Clostridium estertheticum]|uniref:L,D-transpeptidase family protein n=1 Tax=Clostridium estertheticum TaxID=238834 RepID=UPI001CD10818|nr:L,D-transpeptidase/peptidoglycan binding protein [Clostridium estertheticum]MBZ9686878.1 L,D-transpeptidase/peptidoglycan binding protein [Clostridium estertheticum]
MKISIISAFILLVLYLGTSAYFSTHFYFGSVINGINASGKTVAELNKEILLKSETYTLELQERNGVKEQIKSDDIGLKYNANGKIQVLKDNQSSFMWIHGIINQKPSEINGMVTYDKKLLKERFDDLSCFDIKKEIEPQNASFKYLDNGYVIVNEVIGNKVNSKTLYANIVNAILKGETTLNLDRSNNYVNPKYTSSSKEVIATKSLLNKYLASKITYTFNGGNEVLDGSIIHKWLGVNENLEISFDEKEMKDYLNKLDSNYETFGKQREFVTSLGTTINVSGGNYGWLVDRKGEVKDLIVAIKSGQTIAKEPRYIQTAISHNINDIGNTYVEINIAKQHLWFYKNGSLIIQGDFVSGDVSKKHPTPTGVYRVQYKEKNYILKGEGYSVTVNVFLPFNGGIGIHDAIWRDAFGGNIYLTNGSHGCINSPPILAQTIFDNIETGTPVICY